MARTLNSAALNAVASSLMSHAPKAIPVAFVTATPKAATKYSEPMKIVAVHYAEAQKEIRCVGEDGNVRVCKIMKMDADPEVSIIKARQLWTLVKGVHASEAVVSFAAAGGFNPDRWFYTVVQG